MIDKVTGKSVVRRVPVRTRGRARVRDACDPGHRASALELSRDRSGGARSAERARAPRRRPPSSTSWRRSGWPDTPSGSASRSAAPAVMSLDGVGPALLPLVRFDWSLRSMVSRRRRRWPASGRVRPSRAWRAARRWRRRMGCSAAASVSARARGCVPSRRCPRACCARRSKDAPTRRTRAASSTSGRFSSTRASVRRCACPIASPSRSRRTRSWPSRISPFASWAPWSRRPARPNLLLTLTIGAWL